MLFRSSQASKDARDAANGDVTGLIEGTSDPAAGDKGVWAQAMAGGFLALVQFATCQPLHAQVGPYSWTFDHCAVLPGAGCTGYLVCSICCRCGHTELGA